MHLVAKTPKSVALALFAALAATVALAGSAAGQHGTPGTTQLISRPTGTGVASPGPVHGSSVSSGHTVSADGRFVAFHSASDGLSNADDDTMTNVYVRDLQTGTTTFVSRATGPDGAPAHKSSNSAVISSDGTHVAFVTAAALDPLDTNGQADVYVRDLTHNSTTLVSRSGGVSDAVGNKSSSDPSIDGDGNRVVFASTATNLSGADTNGATDIYIHDLAANNTSLVSRASGGGPVGDKSSTEPSISDSGKRVAFRSCADNFDPADTNASCDVYLRDLGTNPPVTMLVSKTSGGLSVSQGAAGPSISGDGTKIAFDSQGSFDPADPDGKADVYLRDLTFGKTALVSRANGLGPVGNAASQSPALDTYGARVVFSSQATNFDAADTNGQGDIYVRDVIGGTTKLVSRADGAAGVGGDASANGPSISADGTKVAFWSASTNFTASPGPDFSHVYLRNLSANTTTLVSRDSGSAPYVADVSDSSFGESFENRISADGRFVVFESYSDSLSNADDNRYSNVFVRDALTDTTTLVSGGPAGGANGNSYDEAISADGTTVAFDSTASNLFAGDSNNASDVFVRNLATGALTHLAVGNGDASYPAVNADGTKVAFESGASLVPADTNKKYDDIYVADLRKGTITLVSRAPGANGAVGDSTSEYPSISADGNRIAFLSYASNFVPIPQTPQVYVRDVAAGTTTLVSRGNGAGAPDNGSPYDAVISGDGNSVAFDSWGDNLVAGDSNMSGDVFVRNIAANTTTLISRGSGTAGALGNDYSYDPSISADGTTVAFDSGADNLVSGDTNKHQDVFVRDLRSGSTTLVSRAANGGPADDSSSYPALSANGNCVAFISDAGNLTPTAPRSDFQRIFMATIARECPVDPPDTRIASAPPALSASRTAAFGFGSNDPLASFQCSLDGSAFAACARAYQTPALADGKHSLAVRALDPAGYADPSPAGASWTIDATPPLVKVGVPKQRLRAVRAKGLRLSLSCNEACTITTQLFRGTRLIGSVNLKLSAPGTQAVRLKLTRKAKRSLAHRKSVRLKLRTSATDVVGNASNSARSLKLRR